MDNNGRWRFAAPIAVTRRVPRIALPMPPPPMPVNDDAADLTSEEVDEQPSSVSGSLRTRLCWDAAGRRYQTLDDLHAYAVRVAGTVGAMMFW